MRQPVGICCLVTASRGDMRWEVGGRVKRERTYLYYLWLLHVDVWQKPAQHCKAVILQLKIGKLKKLQK